MLRPAIKNIILFFVVKYFVFYGIRMVKTDDYRFLKINDLASPDDWFYYLWMILFLPFMSMLLFAVPIYYSFRIKSIYAFWFTILLVFAAEYFVYVFWTSDKHIDVNGIMNGFLSLLLFILFFFREISLKRRNYD